MMGEPPEKTCETAVSYETEMVRQALAKVTAANAEYVDACTRLGKAKIALGRARGHKWAGQSVRLIREATHPVNGKRTREIKGIVTFKGLGEDEILKDVIGFSTLTPGYWYVRSHDGKRAYTLSDADDWQLDLL